MQTALERANPLGLVILAAVAAGLCLRIIAAKGDLWLDEIWTLRLLEPVKSLGDVFFKVHHDNNHFFNSAWIWLIGPDAPILLMRLPAILLGTLGVLAARAVGRRFSEASGAIAALLMAIGYFFVHYGSEARGYAGMILAVLVAYDALLAILDGEARTRNTIVFAAAICVGTFFHLTMVEATAALCASFFARTWSRGDGLQAALRRSLPIGLAAAAATLPAVGLFVHGAFAPDFRVGAMEPFTFALLGQGLSGVARTVLGLPQAMDDAAVVAVAAAFALAMLALVPAGRRWFPAIADRSGPGSASRSAASARRACAATATRGRPRPAAQAAQPPPHWAPRRWCRRSSAARCRRSRSRRTSCRRRRRRPAPAPGVRPDGAGDDPACRTGSSPGRAS